MIGFRALLGVPILLDGEFIGVIAVGRSDVGTFAEEQGDGRRGRQGSGAIRIACSCLRTHHQGEYEEERLDG